MFHVESFGLIRTVRVTHRIHDHPLEDRMYWDMHRADLSGNEVAILQCPEDVHLLDIQDHNETRIEVFGVLD